MRSPWIIAHRGASGHAPENTMASFQRAVELGSTFIETDLQVTRDGHFVAIHDHTVDRTTNGSGEVHSFTLDALRQLDAGLWFDREFMGERLPTLEEIIDFSGKNDVVFYLELKYRAVTGMDHALAAALGRAKSTARTMVISFDASALARLRRIDPAIMMGFLVEDIGPDSIQAALDLGVRQLCPEFSALDGKFVEQAHRADLPVVAWTVNGAEEMRAMIAAGVDGIMTDFPDRLRAVIEDLQIRKSVG
jgi:glycerophosphoryl diester phosphodiesterase